MWGWKGDRALNRDEGTSTPSPTPTPLGRVYDGTSRPRKVSRLSGGAARCCPPWGWHSTRHGTRAVGRTAFPRARCYIAPPGRTPLPRAPPPPSTLEGVEARGRRSWRAGSIESRNSFTKELLQKEPPELVSAWWLAVSGERLALRSYEGVAPEGTAGAIPARAGGSGGEPDSQMVGLGGWHGSLHPPCACTLLGGLGS